MYSKYFNVCFIYIFYTFRSIFLKLVRWIVKSIHGQELWRPVLGFHFLSITVFLYFVLMPCLHKEQKYNDSHNSTLVLFSCMAEKEKQMKHLEHLTDLLLLNTCVSAEHWKGLCFHFLPVKIPRYLFILHRPVPIDWKLRFSFTSGFELCSDY